MWYHVLSQNCSVYFVRVIRMVAELHESIAFHSITSKYALSNVLRSSDSVNEIHSMSADIIDITKFLAFLSFVAVAIGIGHHV